MAYFEQELKWMSLCDTFNHYKMNFDVIGYENSSIHSRDGHFKHA
ncbi:hypothetical protein THF5H11_10489 [Vibrio jasicida]|nr:hypothetical protein THF5H11_10489 [Vibrio jasicida]CAH1607641.1 hypothetical protein THF5G08_40401 [Vibrio jasicida]